MVKAMDIMNANVITIMKDEDIYEAIRVMVLNNITGLPVLNADETLAGIITEKDVLRLLCEMDDRPGTVEDYMTAEVVCFDQHDCLHDVAESLAANPFRRVPILDRGRLVGIISRKDILRHIRELKGQEDILEKDNLLEILY